MLFGERRGDVSEDVVYMQKNKKSKKNFRLKYCIYSVCLKAGVKLDYSVQLH